MTLMPDAPERLVITPRLLVMTVSGRMSRIHSAIAPVVELSSIRMLCPGSISPAAYSAIRRFSAVAIFSR
ncbi:hypothetical protein D9M72_623970 [compost metagenome]